MLAGWSTSVLIRMRSEKEKVLMDVIYVWQIICKWVLEAKKFTSSVGKEKEFIDRAY